MARSSDTQRLGTERNGWWPHPLPQVQNFLKSDRFDESGADVTSKPASQPAPKSAVAHGDAGDAEAETEPPPATADPLPPGLDPNACDTMGWTGLMHAAVTDDAVTARKLLGMGAKHTYRNRFSLSALLWAHWMEASAFREVLRQSQGAEADTLDGNDQKGFDRLKETLERHKGDAAVRSLLRPTGLRKGGSADAGGASVAEKQEDGIQQTKFVMQSLIDEVCGRRSTVGLNCSGSGRVARALTRVVREGGEHPLVEGLPLSPRSSLPLHRTRRPT